MRMLKVRGVAGVNVSNPHTQSMRFIGKEPKGDGTFKECEQVVADHPDIREALQAGDLKCVDLETARIAGVKFEAEKPAKKGGDQ